VLAFPAGAIQFVTFEYVNGVMQGWDKENKFGAWIQLASGALCSLAASVVRIPQEVMKQRIQADVYKNVFEAVPKIWAEHNSIRGFYKGSLATISRDVPWNALSFLFHRQAKLLFERTKGRAPTVQENLALGGISGALAAVIMTPIDVVKTRLMTQTASSGLPQYSGVINTLKQILREEGGMALFKGVIPRVVFLAPLAGITFSVYEAVSKKLIERKQEKARMVAEAAAAPRREGGGVAGGEMAQKRAVRTGVGRTAQAAFMVPSFGTAAMF